MDHPCGRSRSPPYLVLLRAGFCLPPLLPEARCALTAPFHPYPPSPSALRPRAMAWRYIFCATGPSGCPARELPGALSCWSSDFPLPALVPFVRPLLAKKVNSGPVAGSDRLVHYDRTSVSGGERTPVGSRESANIEVCPASRVQRVVQTIQHRADPGVGLHHDRAPLAIEKMVAERHFQLRLEFAL